MKASFVLAGLLLVLVLGETTTVKCGHNILVAKECNPCNQVYNHEPLSRAQYCLETKSFCKCNAGYVLPTMNSASCIRKCQCPALS